MGDVSMLGKPQKGLSRITVSGSGQFPRQRGRFSEVARWRPRSDSAHGAQVTEPTVVPPSWAGRARGSLTWGQGLGDKQEGGGWRRGPESNRAERICNPVHNRFATAPELEKREAKSNRASLRDVERDKRLELSTYTLARYRSTN